MVKKYDLNNEPIKEQAVHDDSVMEYGTKERTDSDILSYSEEMDKRFEYAEDEFDKALFLSSLTPDCFEKATQEESAAFESWLFDNAKH